MLFRPNFCANCGEKIERVDWGPFTSRRFCPVCETEFKGQDLIPRMIVIGGLLIGALGVGAYLKSGGDPPTPVALRQTLRQASSTAANGLQVQAVNSVQVEKQAEVSPADLARQQISVPAAPKPTVETSEPTFYCGAETKKGTPCSRRVKGNGRCFQHKGMPAMVPADKLRSG